MSVTDLGSALWCLDAVQCVLVPDGSSVLVELRNAAGAAFLRKFAPTVQAALNEAEYLRLLLGGEHRRVRPGGLKPFGLVIGGNRYDSDAVVAALTHAGMRAFRCGSGDEGISIAREVSPDIIVLSQGAPDTDGTAMCRMLREDQTTAAIPIIVLTTDPDGVRSRDCVADAVLTMPCPTETLCAAARLFIRHLTYVEHRA